MRIVRLLPSTIMVNGTPKSAFLGDWALEKLSAEKFFEFSADMEIVDNTLEPYYTNGSIIPIPVLDDLQTANGTIKHIVGTDYVQNVLVETPPEYTKWMTEMKNHPDTITFRDFQIL